MEIVDKIKGLDLSKYPAEQIKQLLASIPRYMITEIDFPVGYTILRGRPNSRINHFYTRDSLKYVPKERNISYRRASTPQNTMFYGCIVPGLEDNKDFKVWRLWTAAECVPEIFSDEIDKGYQRLTFSRWRIDKTITVVAIAGHKHYSKPHPYYLKLNETLKTAVEAHCDNKAEILELSDFFSSEFAKPVESDKPFDYLISSLFTEAVCSKGYDGVLYPSIKGKGAGFNIALTANATDDKLSLIASAECTVYRKGKSYVMSNDTQKIITDQILAFGYSKVPPQYRVTQDQCLRKLGVKNLSELEE
jgi:hypothetical protein